MLLQSLSDVRVGDGGCFLRPTKSSALDSTNVRWE